MSILFLFLGSMSTAHAVPVQLSQQGRLLDSAGATVNGIHTLTFRFYDAQFGGNILWEDNVSVAFEDGYYSTLIGDSSSNPLDESVLSNSSVYLEMEFNGGGPIGGRQEVVSAPYARMAGTASNIDGGSVNATEISVSGQMVIDANGSWVGPTMAVNWNDVQNIPADIADGDDDSLSGLACSTGQIVGWDGAGWICTDDNGLTESEVEAYVTNDAIDLHANSTVGGMPILTQGDGDTLSGLSCQSGDVAKFDSVLGWQCGLDMDTSDWSTLANVPAGFADGVDDDTQLSEAEVENYVVNGGLDLHPTTTVNGLAIMTAPTCLDGQVLEYNAGTANWFCADINQIATCSGGEMLMYDDNANTWACTTLADMMDADQDGVMTWSDCDDNDPNAGSSQTDKDCDGVPTWMDCDDFDPNSVTTNEDGDCDGLLTADDCDDSNPNSTAIANDADCDGVETVDDCDDNNAISTVIANDADCDGVTTANDCNDLDPASTTVANDADCDGIETAIDCNDNDATASIPGSSADCTAANCLETYNADPTSQDGTYWIDTGGSGPIELYCDMTLDGGGWTLVYHNNAGNAISTNSTSQQGNTSSLTSPSAGHAKLSDYMIASLKTNSNNTIGYRVTSNNTNYRYFSPSSCNYTHTSSASDECRQYVASYSTGSPNYTQCSEWGGGGGGLNAWYNCNGSWDYTNVFITHKGYAETSGITSNTSGSSNGSSGTSYGNDVLMWVR